MKDTIRLASELAVARTEPELLAALLRNADSVGATAVKISYMNASKSCLAPFVVGPGRELYLAAVAEVADRLSPLSDEPVVSHLRERSDPIWWDRHLYERAGLSFDWEFFAGLGYCSGISVALHLAENRHTVFSLIWDDRPRPLKPDLADLAATVQTLAVFSEPAIHRLATSQGLPHLDGALSQRELQCLFWASRGLTDDDTGLIAKISPSTVRKHIDSSVRKLGAINRTHAAVLATKRGVLTSDLAQL